MKDITNDNPNPNRDQIHQQREARRENKHIGRIRPKKGHRSYKFSEGVLSELKDSDYYDEEITIETRPGIDWYNSLDKDGNRVRPGNRNIKKSAKNTEGNYQQKVKKIKVEPNTHYFTALNLDNAKKYCRKNLMLVRLINV